MTNMTLGEILRDLREGSGLTQTELAIKIGISQRKVSHLERGDIEPNMEDLRRFCAFFRVSADYLLGLPDDLSYPRR